MPLCNTRNKTYGLTTACCDQSNCNQIQKQAVVNRCYTGGAYTDETNATITLPTLSKECRTPNNQYCQVKY